MNSPSNHDSRILVIDDDSITRKTLEKTLSRSGYKVSTCVNGRDGFEKAIEERPDIILLDVMMPVMNGYEACKKLREVYDHNEVKIIMLTGMNDSASVDLAFEAGANDFITKPINWPILVMRVKYALRERYMYFQLVENEARLKQAQRMAGISYWEYDPKHDDFQVAGVFVDNVLQGQSSVSKNAFFNLIDQEDREFIHEEFCRICLNGGSYDKDHRIFDNENNELIFQQQGEAIFGSDGELIRVIGTLQDITREHRAAAIIEYQKYYDDLTGVPNKHYYYRELENIINDKIHGLTAVLFIGLDRFKSINNSLGYKVGDELLKQAVGRITGLLINAGILSRYSGNNFSLIIQHLNKLDQLELIMAGLLKSMTMPFVIDGEEVFTSCSVGVVVHPMEQGDAVHLTECAEAAMNQARLSGGNQYCYHSSELSEKARTDRIIEKKIRYAMENNRFVLFYQPQIDIKTGACIGAEALIRMQDENNIMVSPVDFIPVAEDTGLIVDIGYWIIDSACMQINRWRNLGMHNLRVGINLSARQFNDPKLVNRLNQAVEKYSVPVECIDIEITESTIMSDMNETLRILNEFKRNGYTISMDDFGTGYSSLSYLQQMPVDILKIDRAFIKDIGENGENSEIAKTIIAMGHALNMTIIAEGAETESHMRFLYQASCDEVQGYFYSPPLSVKEFNSFYFSLQSSLGNSLNACN